MNMEETKPYPCKLKPCPFCGSKAELYTYGVFSGLGPDLVCTNTKCPARMRCKYEDVKSLKKLIKAWNTRAKEPNG